MGLLFVLPTWRERPRKSQLKHLFVHSKAVDIQQKLVLEREGKSEREREVQCSQSQLTSNCGLSEHSSWKQDSRFRSDTNRY